MEIKMYTVQIKGVQNIISPGQILKQRSYFHNMPCTEKYLYLLIILFILILLLLIHGETSN